MHYPLLTERLSIRPLDLPDVAAFVAYRQDPAIARFQGWDTNFSDDDARALVESQAGVALPDKGEWLQLAIHDRMTGALAGDVALHRVPDTGAVFEIGFTIARAFHAQGYAKEAASRLMDYLISEVDASKFVAHTDRRNSASVGLLLALGFVNIPSRSWTENFKGEHITMDYFEARPPAL